MINLTKIYKIIISFMVLIVLAGAGYKFYTDIQNDMSDPQKLKLLSEKELIVDNSIQFISSLFKYTQRTLNHINFLLITNHYSCDGCNEIGKYLVNTLNEYPVYTLALVDNEGFLPIRSEYFVRSDSIFQITEKIHNITTPVILKFDCNFIVKDAFFPGIDSKTKFRNFIRSK